MKLMNLSNQNYWNPFLCDHWATTRRKNHLKSQFDYDGLNYIVYII